MSVDPKRTVAELKELRALTSDDNGAQRVAWTDTWLKAREWFSSKLAGLPVEDHRDAAGNRWITLPGESPQALLLGGHLDSVPNGGWLDGCLDVMAALEVMRGFAKKYNGRPPLTIRVVDWADEEGARFGRSLLGSSAFAGTHSIAADRVRTDKDGIRLEEALGALRRRQSTTSPTPRASRKTRRRISSCTSSKGPCSKAWACRSEWCWAPKAWNGTRSRSTDKRRIRVRHR